MPIAIYTQAKSSSFIPKESKEEVRDKIQSPFRFTDKVFVK